MAQGLGTPDLAYQLTPARRSMCGLQESGQLPSVAEWRCGEREGEKTMFAGERVDTIGRGF